MADGEIHQDSIKNAVSFLGSDRRVGIELPDSCVVSGVKRLIGREFSDLSNYAAILGCPVSMGPSGRPMICTEYSPEEVTAMVLGHVKSLLASQFHEEVVDAVITVPAYFSNSQRQAMIDAASIASFKVLRLQSDAVAALLVRPQTPQDCYIVVVDFGAGKLDLSLVQKQASRFVILTTGGDTQFGGMDLDSAICDVIESEYPSDISRWELLARCRVAREMLSSADETTLDIGDHPRVLTRQELNAILAPFYRRLIEYLDGFFEGQCVRQNDVSEVHIVGGLCQIPEILDVFRGYFGESVQITRAERDAVLLGAILEARIVKGEPIEPPVEIRTTTALSLGFSLADGTCSVLIPRGTQLPATYSRMTTTAKDNQRNIAFDITEGERAMAKDNVKLGTVHVAGIERAPRGVPQIRIDMEVNADGILTVTATDLKTGALFRTTIQSRSNLSRSEIAAMVADGEANRAEDERMQKLALWKGRLVAYVDSIAGTEASAGADFLAQVQEWRSWNAEHADEQLLETVVLQYLKVREVVKGLASTEGT
jgi:molecular chaperone DnaK (HSP70)